MDSRLRGNDKERSITTQSWVPAIPAKVFHAKVPPFPQRSPRHSRKGLPPFPQRSPRHSRKTPRHSRKNSPSFPRRRESIGHYSDSHWDSFLESTESSMPGFHFFRRFYVERSVGFVGHDVDLRCFMTGVLLWIPAFAGMTKKDQSPRSHGFPPFPQRSPRHSRKGLPVIPAKVFPKAIPAKHSPSFPKNSPSFPQNSPSFPRRRESIGYYSDPH